MLGPRRPGTAAWGSRHEPAGDSTSSASASAGPPISAVSAAASASVVAGNAPGGTSEASRIACSQSDRASGLIRMAAS